MGFHGRAAACKSRINKYNVKRWMVCGVKHAVIGAEETLTKHVK